MSVQDEEPAPLGQSARRFIDAARPHEGLAAERKARLRASVLGAVAAGGAVGAAAGAAKAAEIAGAAGSAGASVGTGASVGAGAGLGAGAVKAAGLSLFAKIGISVAIVTLGAGGVLWSRAHDETARPAVSTVASTAALTSVPQSRDGNAAPGETVQDAPAGSASASAAPTGSDAPAAPDASERPAASARGSGASAEPVDPLQEETKLLSAAHAELSRGNAAGALAFLDQHAARFPRGALATERRATRAMALCKAGRADEGRREMAALYGGDTKSPMAQKIDRACGK